MQHTDEYSPGQVDSAYSGYSAPPAQHKKIECVIVCDRYADFLAETIVHNKAHFDKLVVVTSFEDKATQRICEYQHVECIPTDVIESRKGNFNKAEAINVGLAALSKDDWIVHLDADMILPPLFRKIMQELVLDKTMIYGIDRFMVRDFTAWREFMEMPRLQHENGSWLHPSAFDLGTRVIIPAFGGYMVVGFCQIWNKASDILKYPEGHNTAARTDLQFSMLWPRAKREMLPEIIGYHLESERAPHGANWGGRTTQPFTHDGEERTVYQPMDWEAVRHAKKG